MWEGDAVQNGLTVRKAFATIRFSGVSKSLYPL